MKNPNEPIVNQTNNFQASNTMRQPTATPRRHSISVGYLLFFCDRLVKYLLHYFFTFIYIYVDGTHGIGRYKPFKYEAQTALFKDPVRTAQ